MRISDWSSDVCSSDLQAFYAILATIVGVLAITVIFSFFVVRAISGPLGRLTSATQRLAEGDLEAEIEDRQSRDEIGRLLAAVRVFKENLVENRRLQAEQREA